MLYPFESRPNQVLYPHHLWRRRGRYQVLALSPIRFEIGPVYSAKVGVLDHGQVRN